MSSIVLETSQISKAAWPIAQASRRRRGVTQW
jgi:hypothetical protein